jgi:NAD+ kinase
MPKLRGKKKSGRKHRKNGMSILLVAKQNKAGLAALQKTEKMLRRYTDDIHVDRSSGFRLRRIGTSIRKFRGDLIITLGGDGTFLLTAHRANVPILPVRIEGKGFLCTTDYGDLQKHLPALFKKKYSVSERMRLKCTKIMSGKISKYIGKIRHSDYPLSVNEIAFARKRPSKLLNIEMEIDGVSYSVVGDGIMFSTPSGSTAYNASAGGPIIDQKLPVISVLPLYPFYSKAKPMVVPADKQVFVTVRGGECALIVDGHGGDYFKSDSRFVIEKAKPAKVIVFDEQNFYERVKRTLLEE